MRKLCTILLLLAMVAGAANVKLYLTDGSYHLVREYQVQTDRVRYYSVERNDWEEIPLELVDLRGGECVADGFVPVGGVVDRVEVEALAFDGGLPVGAGLDGNSDHSRQSAVGSDELRGGGGVGAEAAAAGAGGGRVGEA